MKVVILSKSPYIFSTQLLQKELTSKKLEVEIINPLECDISSFEGQFKVYNNSKELNNIDFIIPRIGSASHYYGIYVLEAFERNNIRLLNSSESILLSRTKYKSYTLLQDKGLPVPATALIKTADNVDLLLDQLGGFPVILKLTRGSQGKGVMLIDNKNTLKSVIETIALFEEDVILQQYIRTRPENSDIRLYILNKKVIGATRRINHCDFRSNTHCGGIMEQIQVDEELKNLALKTAESFKLNFCSVDFLIDNNSPKILEINSTPGFEKVETEARIRITRMLSEYVRDILCLTG